MMILRLLALTLAPTATLAVPQESAAALKGEYFGQPKPGAQAERLLLPVPTSQPDHHVRAVTFSPDGTEAYWPVIDTQDNYKR